MSHWALWSSSRSPRVRGQLPDDEPESTELDPAVAQFTANLREARRRAGLTQEAVALASGVPQGHYSRMETGKRDPGIRTLVRIAAALNTTAAELLAGVKNR
jgi:DNA-binding XRE family transcriptional regulator